MRVLIDVTDTLRVGFVSGIQRVVREIVTRAIRDERLDVRLLCFDPTTLDFVVVSSENFLAILADSSQGVTPDVRWALDDFGPEDAFLDIDCAWNSPLTRSTLYSRLAQRGTVIITMIHDFVPLELPHTLHPDLIRNWITYIAAVYAYSDLVLPISRATERDFERLAGLFGARRRVPTLVARLGGDIDVAVEPTDDELEPLRSLLNSRFLVFVGTLEPRKRHRDALIAFQKLSDEFSDLQLVFVGRYGWEAEETVESILQHPLWGTRLHWLSGASDPLVANLLSRAVAAVYLSDYEGFGLPVIEAINRGTPVVTSRNSAIPEAGRDQADYVDYASSDETASIIRAYLLDPGLLDERRRIVAEFAPTQWDQAYRTIGSMLALLDDSIAERARPRPETLPFVTVSDDPAAVTASIAACDERCSAVAEYVIVAAASVHPLLTSIHSRRPIRLIDLDALIGRELAQSESSETVDAEVKRGWSWRHLTTIEGLDERFVLFDAGIVPLQQLALDDFVDLDGRQVAASWGELNQPSSTLDDPSVAHTARFLDTNGFETRGYASRQPQVIDARLYAEALRIVDALDPSGPIDIWSAYFNIAISRRPLAFRKEAARSLDAPQQRGGFSSEPPRYALFIGDEDELRQRVDKRGLADDAAHRARRLHESSRAILERAGLAIGRRGYGAIEGPRVYATGVPQVIVTTPQSDLDLVIGYQLVDVPLDLVPRVSLHSESGELGFNVLVHPAGTAALTVRSGEAGLHRVDVAVDLGGETLLPFTDSHQLYLAVAEDEAALSSLLSESGLLGGQGHDEPRRRPATADKPRPTPQGGIIRRTAKRLIRFFFPSVPVERQRLRTMSEQLDQLVGSVRQLETQNVLLTEELHRELRRLQSSAERDLDEPRARG